MALLHAGASFRRMTQGLQQTPMPRSSSKGHSLRSGLSTKQRHVLPVIRDGRSGALASPTNVIHVPSAACRATTALPRSCKSAVDRPEDCCRPKGPSAEGVSNLFQEMPPRSTADVDVHVCRLAQDLQQAYAAMQLERKQQLRQLFLREQQQWDAELAAQGLALAKVRD